MTTTTSISPLSSTSPSFGDFFLGGAVWSGTGATPVEAESVDDGGKEEGGGGGGSRREGGGGGEKRVMGTFVARQGGPMTLSGRPKRPVGLGAASTSRWGISGGKRTRATEEEAEEGGVGREAGAIPRSRGVPSAHQNGGGTSTSSRRGWCGVMGASSSSSLPPPPVWAAASAASAATLGGGPPPRLPLVRPRALRRTSGVSCIRSEVRGHDGAEKGSGGTRGRGEGKAPDGEGEVKRKRSDPPPPSSSGCLGGGTRTKVSGDICVE